MRFIKTGKEKDLKMFEIMVIDEDGETYAMPPKDLKQILKKIKV